MQFNYFNNQLNKYQFQFSGLGFLLVCLCVPLFIKLGFWQFHKGEARAQLHEAIAQAQSSDGVNLAAYLKQAELLHTLKVKLKGNFEPQYQFLLDNQVENSEGGFHVITPFKLAGTHQYVLVNRGWVKGKPVHSDLPSVVTPKTQLLLTGIAWLPSDKIFSLEKPNNSQANSAWPMVWQNLEMKKFKSLAPIKVLPIIIKLDANSQAGFVRNWQIPADNAAKNFSYAYQWFGFAFAAIMIFLYTSFKRK